MTPRYRLSFISLAALSAAMPAMAQQNTVPSGASVAQQQPGGQDSPGVESGTPNTRERETIIVTANKREESVQDIPVAITAITSESKQELGIISVTDLTNVTPGLSYTPGDERVTLRGIGRLSNSFGADPGVANYNDGIYTAFAVFAGKDPLLIDRVEVLRGPQGTLYGRNAIGGAINTISKRPTDDFAVEAVVGVGNYNAKKLGASVSGPITDWLRYRAVGLSEYRDGIDFNYGENDEVGWEINDHYLEGQLEGDIGDNLSWWVKVADLRYDKQGPPGGRTATFSTAPYLTNVNPLAQFSSGGIVPNGAFGFSNNASVIGVTQLGSRRDNPFATNREHAYNTNLENNAILRAYDEAIGEVIYEAPGFDIKYVGGYQYYDYELPSDADGTPITSVTYNAVTSTAPIPLCASAAAVRGFPVASAQAAGAGPCITGTAPRTIFPNVTNVYRESRGFFSNELNLISTWDSPFQWIFGLYQYSEDNDQPGQVQYLYDEPLASFYLDTVLGVVPNADREVQRFKNKGEYRAYGVYGQADYSFSDQFKVTAGLRYSKDEKTSQEQAFLACYIICGVDYLNYTRIAYNATTTPGPTITYDSEGVANRTLVGEWDAVTGTAGLEFTPTTATLLFAKYSRGYKAGAFNNLGFAPNPYADPEFVDAYEAGWKQEWDALRLTTNAALFFNKYKDFQAPLGIVIGQQGATGSTTATVFENVDAADLMGFELESNWNPIDPLNINVTYAYLNTEITESGVYVDTTRNPAVSGGVFVDPGRQRSVVGNRLPQSPEHKAAIQATYRIDLESGAYFLPTVSWSWRDYFYTTFFNNTLEKSPSYHNVDARLNFYTADGRFQITGWVRNLLDDEQNTSVGANGFRVQDQGRYQTFSYSLPRTYGVDLIFRY